MMRCGQRGAAEMSRKLYREQAALVLADLRDMGIIS